MKRVIMLAFSLMTHTSGAQDFWQQDVWQEPDKPFLYYGQKPETERPTERLPQAAEQAAQLELEQCTTLEELQRVVQQRLHRAVMQPTSQAVALYLQANAYLMHKAGRFAQVWRDTLQSFPQYDWTAQHPTVNAASTALVRAAQSEVEQTLEGLPEHWGYIFFADDSALTAHMARIVRDFTVRWGFEAVWVSTVPDNAALGQALNDQRVHVDAQLAAHTAHGITLFPALVLVAKSDTSLRQARLIATGVVDAAELARRTVRATQGHTP